MPTQDVYFEDVKEGDAIPELVKPPVTETQLVMYSGASGDFNPLHTVHEAGVKAGFDGVIGHGQLGMAFLGQLLTDWIDNRDIRNLSVNFRGVTKPKDVLTCKGTIVKKYTDSGQHFVELDLVAENQRGEQVISGKSTVVLPAKS